MQHLTLNSGFLVKYYCIHINNEKGSRNKKTLMSLQALIFNVPLQSTVVIFITLSNAVLYTYFFIILYSKQL